MRSRALSLAALAFLAGLMSLFGDREARAQNLDANKTPGQIFASTCSACHRSARGIVKGVAPSSLAGFLRQHYTTSNEMASVMAAYVMGSGGTDRVAEPSAKRDPKQKAAQQPDTPESAAARLQAQQERRERAKAERQKAAKKGKSESTEASKPAEDASKPAEPVDGTKPDAPIPPQGDATAAPVAAETATPSAPSSTAQPLSTAETPPATPAPRTGIILPGFPLPEDSSEPPAASASAPRVPAATVPEAPAQPQPASNEPTIMPVRPDIPLAPSNDAPKTDIMQEEVHTPKPVAPRKKRSD